MESVVGHAVDRAGFGQNEEQNEVPAATADYVHNHGGIAMRKSLLCALLTVGLACVFGVSCATQDGAGAKEVSKEAKPAKSSTGMGGGVAGLPNMYVKISLKEGEVSKTWDSVFNGSKPLTISDAHPSFLGPGYPVIDSFTLELSKSENDLVLSFKAGQKMPVMTGSKQVQTLKTEQPPAQPPKEPRNAFQEVKYQDTGVIGTANVKLGEPLMLINNGERTVTLTISDKPLPTK